MFMHDEEQRRLEIVRACYSQQEQMDLLSEYVELRLLLDDPHATMKVNIRRAAPERKPIRPLWIRTATS